MSYADNKRIAKNTVFMYVRTFVSMVIALYTSRKILEILGIDDFGILNVVGGVIAMMTFLNGSMSVATQRFLTFEIGRNSQEGFRNTFSMACIIHAILAAIVLLLGETVGVWFVNSYLNIPAARMMAANVVYQMSMLSCVVGILQTPYNASIISYERMHVYAYVGLGESLTKLVIVFLLLVSPTDKLITYSILLFGVQLASCIIYRVYCHHYFTGCRVSLKWNKSIFREMVGFTGWNMFGTIAWLLKDNGASILLNIFGGPAVNAARGVASQVTNASTSLMGGFQSAVNPQITKNYAANDREHTCLLMCRSSKFSYFLMYVIALPVLLECDFLLDIWLVEVPSFAVLFTQIVLIEALCNTLGGPMITSLMATGKIKWYQIIVGSILLLNIPVAWFLLQLGYHIATPLIVSLIVMIIGHLVRIIFCKLQIGLSLRDYCRTVFVPIITVTVLAGVIAYGIHYLLSEGLIRLITTSIVSVLSITAAIYLFGLDTAEKTTVTSVIKSKMAKLLFLKS